MFSPSNWGLVYFFFCSMLMATSSNLDLMYTNFGLPFSIFSEMSSEESDYEQEYEVLSDGTADAWDETEQGWISATPLDAGGPSVSQNNTDTSCEHDDANKSDKELRPTNSRTAFQDEGNMAVTHNIVDSEGDGKLDDNECLDLENLEQLMSEIGNMRSGLRLMPDFQRREMAAKLAMKMASLFGGESDDGEI